VLSHGTNDGLDEEPVEAHNSYQRTTTPGIGRSRTEILELMTGTELVEPGIVWTPQWRPDSPEDVDEHPSAHSSTRPSPVNPDRLPPIRVTPNCG